MKFQNAILTIATATLSGINNNVADAKLWNLRGFGNAHDNNNNNEEVYSESLPSVVEELPSPTANLRELSIDEEQQGERRLPKKKDTEAKAEKEKGSKGQKIEKIGEAVYTEAPDDVVAKAGCDEPIDEDDDGARFRRFLAKGEKEKAVKTKGTKANKEDLSTGACESFSTNEERTKEDVDISGVDVAVEAAEFPTCDPDADEPCENEEFLGDDPTLIPPEGYEEGEGEGAAFEATSRELMERDLIEGRRLTGNTNQIGDFAPLSCNPVEFDCTGAAGLSSVVSDASNPVTVPCGTCLVVSK